MRGLPTRPVACAWLLVPAAALFCAAALACAAAFASSVVLAAGGPSVLVSTTRVREGALPRIVRVYGTAQASPSARDAVVAPLAATVGAVYVRVGEEVAKGAPLMRLVPTPQSAAQYAQAVSALRNASALVTHTRELLDQRLATRQQLSSAENAESDARASLDALKAQGAAGAATLRAPFRSVVTAISATAQAIAPQGALLLQLVRPGALVLNAGVVPDRASAVEPGDRARVTAIAGSQAFAAQVAMRGSVVDAATGLVPVEISLPAGALLPGQWAEAAITVGMVRGYVVPHEAILVNDNGDTYLVQARNGVARIVPVTVLAASGAQDAVSGRLDVEAPVVLTGNHQLQDGMRLRFPDPSGATSR